MNAYELADWLTEHSFLKDTEIAMMPVINMLRQQADRIAELEKDLNKYDQLAWDDLSNSKTIWCDCGDGITANSGAKCGICASTTPQTKPLSDEEICDLWLENSYGLGLCNIAFEYARAIEERHGIK